MEDKMAAGAFGRNRNYGWDDPFNCCAAAVFYKPLASTAHHYITWIHRSHGKPLLLNTVIRFSSDIETGLHKTRKPFTARDNRWLGSEGVPQLFWLHQDRHRVYQWNNIQLHRSIRWFASSPRNLRVGQKDGCGCTRVRRGSYNAVNRLLRFIPFARSWKNSS